MHEILRHVDVLVVVEAADKIELRKKRSTYTSGNSSANPYNQGRSLDHRQGARVANSYASPLCFI